MSIASKLHDKASITRGKRAKRPLKFVKCGRCGKEFHKSGPRKEGDMIDEFGICPEFEIIGNIYSNPELIK